LEGLVAPERLEALVQSVRDRGGLVSTRRTPDGSDVPYELNVTYFSALGSESGLPAQAHAERFLASQAFMLAMRGIPGVYFHSLVGTPNDLEGVRATGRNRSINRRKYTGDELRQILGNGNSAQRTVFGGYRNLLKTRIKQAAFHPDAQQRVLPTNQPALIALERISQDGGQHVVVMANVGPKPLRVDLSTMVDVPLRHDLISGRSVVDHQIDLNPYRTLWLV
jgi:sucrose phosphorylase